MVGRCAGGRRLVAGGRWPFTGIMKEFRKSSFVATSVDYNAARLSYPGHLLPRDSELQAEARRSISNSPSSSMTNDTTLLYSLS